MTFIKISSPLVSDIDKRLDFGHIKLLLQLVDKASLQDWLEKTEHPIAQFQKQNTNIEGFTNFITKTASHNRVFPQFREETTYVKERPLFIYLLLLILQEVSLTLCLPASLIDECSLTPRCLTPRVQISLFD